MLTLYAMPISNFCAKVEIALKLKELAYDYRAPPDGYGSQRYKAIVPMGTIPALVDGDLVLSESEAILEYLDEAWRAPPLLPPTVAARARARQLSRLHDSRFEPCVRSMFATMSPTNRAASDVAARLELLERRYLEIANLAEPAPFLAGDNPGMPDCAFAPTLHLADRMLDVLNAPRLRHDRLEHWRSSILAVPAFAEVLARHDEAITAWLATKGA